ncbi:MAG: UvrD-helicase domain-containing protein, partial [Candidatus Eremiobacteraeota bacterium]|nr:UvrD-helicase domain-containing protein [Candidatus Eremiobacteraeota bacterium]
MIGTSVESGCTVIIGSPASGKTRELLARAGAQDPSRIFVGSPHLLGARRLAENLPSEALCGTPATLAFAILRAHEFASGLALELERIEDVDAETHFEDVAGPLFALEWVDLIEPELGVTPSIDFEIAGLRAPQRFAQAAYRLFRKLRGAGIGPQRFLEIALRKSAEWYAQPPNLGSPDLLLGTPERHRDSLAADSPELERQRRREVDLAKILQRTYALYVEDAQARGCLTDVDAIAEAYALLYAAPDLAAEFRKVRPLAFVDDAQDLTMGEFEMLRRLYGETLDGVTLAGDPEQATRTFSGARPDRTFACGTPLELPAAAGSAGSIVALARAFLRGEPLPAEGRAGIVLHRAPTQDAEAAEMARALGESIRGGASADRLAVLLPSLRGARRYVDALLRRDLPVRLVGDLDL